MARVLLENVSNVGDLVEALSKLPPETNISPFGSGECMLVYDEEEGNSYIDENFSWALEEYGPEWFEGDNWPEEYTGSDKDKEDGDYE